MTDIVEKANTFENQDSRFNMIPVPHEMWKLIYKLSFVLPIFIHITLLIRISSSFSLSSSSSSSSSSFSSSPCAILSCYIKCLVQCLRWSQFSSQWTQRCPRVFHLGPLPHSSFQISFRWLLKIGHDCRYKNLNIAFK